MHDRLDAVERPTDRVAVAHVTGVQLDVGVQIGGTLAVAVHLTVEVVERAHLVAVGEQPVGEMRSDEAGAAGNQNLHGRA